MGKIRRRFDAQFKQEICQAVISGQDIREICQDHQLHRQTIERWIARFQQGEPLGKPSVKEKALERENEKLKAKIGELVVHIDLLKKFHQTLSKWKTVRSGFQAALKRAGLPHMRFHDLRHSFVTNCAEKGISWDKTSLITGHRSYQMYQRYRHFFDRSAREVVESFKAPTNYGEKD